MLAGLFGNETGSVRGTLDQVSFSTAQLFWCFVVAMWPLVYWRVYLT